MVGQLDNCGLRMILNYWLVYQKEDCQKFFSIRTEKETVYACSNIRVCAFISLFERVCACVFVCMCVFAPSVCVDVKVAMVYISFVIWPRHHNYHYIHPPLSPPPPLPSPAAATLHHTHTHTDTQTDQHTILSSDTLPNISLLRSHITMNEFNWSNRNIFFM